MSLVVPGSSRPTNLHLPPEAAAAVVESDVYGICNRVAEISRRLYILVLMHDNTYGYAIMEKCEDGVDRLVFRVKELDDRVVKRLQKLMGLDFSVRYEQLEKEEFKLKEEAEEEAFEELYERMGRPMWTQLEHDGFIQRGVSYAKRGVAGK